MLERELLRLERELFLGGRGKAFAIVGGGAACDAWRSAARRRRARAAAGYGRARRAAGIDIFSTSANAGWPLQVVAAEGEPYHRYALLLVE